MHVLNGIILQTGFQLPFPTGSNIKAIDLKGATVLSGFSDAHVHLSQTGITKSGCNLEDALSLVDVFDLLRVQLELAPMILAFNFEEHNVRENRLPTIAELDKLSSDKILWIARKDLHSAILNSAAIAWARKLLPDLTHDDGFISGESYNVLCYKLVDEIPDQMLIQGMELTARDCLKKGVVCIHALEGSTNSVREAKLANNFFKKSKLDGVVYHQSLRPDFALENDLPGFGGCLLVDGSLGTRTAALNEPYEDSPGENGNLYMSASEMETLIKTARNARLQLALHAIGDRAIDTVTASYVWARDKYRIHELPDRIEHFVLPSAKAIKAARTSEAMVCIQPLFDYFWGGKGKLYEKRLGKSRAEKCNPFKTLMDLGISLACGSDSPVTPIDPILGVHALVNHSNPEEQIDLNSALSLYILEPHRFIGKSKIRGQLKTGFKADFICLSEDPFMVPENRIKSIKVQRTFINGVEV